MNLRHDRFTASAFRALIETALVSHHEKTRGALQKLQRDLGYEPSEEEVRASAFIRAYLDAKSQLLSIIPEHSFQASYGRWLQERLLYAIRHLDKPAPTPTPSAWWIHYTQAWGELYTSWIRLTHDD